MKMKINKKVSIVFVFVIGIFLMLSFVSSYHRSGLKYVSNFRDSGLGSFQQADREMCEAGQDFIIQISPFGCEPAVVRSDLLEEQNVAVFCKLGATKLNPLIDVKAIDKITFKNDYPKEVSGVGFHPAQSALGYRGDLNSPVLNNIGYAVIVLKQQKNESAMPDFVSGNLTATIRYNIENAYGIGKVSFYLPEMSDAEFNNKYLQYGFWDGRGYLRAESIEDDRATIGIYSDRSYPSRNSDKIKMTTVHLKKGELSQKIYGIPGFDYCMGNFQLRLHDLEAPDTRAKLKINNDMIEVKDGEKFLDDKCWIRNIEKYGLNQKVKIKCKQEHSFTSDSFTLAIKPKVKINISGKIQEYSVGDWMYDVGEQGAKKVYLGYIGIDSKGNKFIIPVVSKAKNSEDFKETLIYSSLPNAVKSLNFNSGNIALNLIKNTVTTGVMSISSVGEFLHSGDYPYGLIYSEGSEKKSLKIGKNPLKLDIHFIGLAGPQDVELEGEAKEYYEKALQDYNTIQDSFSGTKYNNESISEEALYNLIKLSFNTGQKKTTLELCDEFKEKYPDSKKSLKSYCEDEYKLSSSEISSKNVLVDNAVKTISFEGIIEPSEEEYSAEVSIKGLKKGEDGKKKEEFNNPKMVLKKGVKYHLLGGDTVELVDLEDDSATVKFQVEETAGGQAKSVFHFSGKDTKIKLHDRATNIGKNNYIISVNKIKLKKMAKVSIKPNIDYTTSTSNFKFKVEIEKRAIQLAPDKIKGKIEKWDKINNQLEKISNTMGSSIKVLKSACLATQASLTIKNFIENTKGKGIARQEVMRGDDGWYEKCADYVEKGIKNYKNVDDCLIGESDNIDEEVNLFYNEIQKQDKEIKNIQTDKDCYVQDNVLKGKVVNTTKFVENYIPKVKDSLSNELDGAGEINISKIKSALNTQSLENGKVSLEQLKKIELYSNILDDSNLNPETEKSVKKRLSSILLDVQKNSEADLQRQTFKDDFGVPEIDYGVSEKSKEIAFSKDILWKTIKSKFDTTGISIDDKSFVRIYIDKSGSEKYLIVLTNDYTVNATYLIGEGNKPSLTKKENKNFLDLDYKKYDSSVYENKYIASLGDSVPILRYYETAPYKGYPAIVPFDKDEGWYVAVKQTLGVAGNIRSYDESAKVNSFWLCNVGENGLEENIKGDDICEMINRGTRQPYDKFYGLEPGKASQLIRRAESAVQSAQAQYEKAMKNHQATIQGWVVKVGNPAVEIPEIQCQDSMSPKECNILFNVCDPVMCPSSRCDFGGRYPVKDVVQSGIIGSIALCAPNFPQVKIPICLTGVKAGLDSFISVTTAYQDCLQHSLDTGEQIGVCDEIHSIYLCDFFWRQSLPLTKMIVPKIVETIMGQNVRGGGEYLGVQNAWANVENSINYFTQYYAQNSFKAFKTRSTDEVGGSICKAFTSVAYPDSGGLLDSLTEPDSPAQFSGKFDEIPMTTATNPPISHYKVYYHIYAGKDRGAYYQVYLKGTEGTSFYGDANSRYVVDTNYIGKGEYTSQTKDIQLPSGYSEMCIVVNEHEECGFKQVSTSFAVNYVKDKYLEEQASQTDIKTEKACVSGTASFYNLLNPNVQAGVESEISPEIYNRGITRICATKNPGAGTDTSQELYSETKDGTKYSGTWQEVGYCGDKNIKCWLDTQSVKDAIEFTNLEGNALEKTTNNFLETLQEQEGYLSEKEFKAKVGEIEKEKDYLNRTKLVKVILNKVIFDYEKSYLYLLRGNAFGKLAVKEYNIWLENQPKPEEEKTTTYDRGDLRKRVLDAAKKLDGTSSEKDKVVKDYDGNSEINCWDSVMHVYNEAGVGTSKTIFSLGKGTNLEIINSQGNKESFEIPYASSKRGEETRRDNLLEGDILSIVYTGRSSENKPAPHNVIFIKWINKEKKIAELFDWNNYIKGKKLFGYFEYDLSNNKHPVYSIWEPVLKGSYNDLIAQVETAEYKLKPESFEEDILKKPESIIFEFDDGNLRVTNFYYKYSQNKYWMWSKDGKKDWMNVSDPLPKPTFFLHITEKNKKFIQSLKDKDFEQGLAYLIKRTGEDEEGGWFYNPVLKTDNVEMSSKLIFTLEDYLEFVYNQTDKSWYWRYKGDKKLGWIKTDIFIDDSALKKAISNLPSKFRPTPLKYYHRALIDRLKDENLWVGAKTIYLIKKNSKDLSESEEIKYLCNREISEKEYFAIVKFTNDNGLNFNNFCSNNLIRISNKHIVSLEANEMNIKNISELRNLENLKSLYLNGNQIKDISSLSNLKSLKILFLNDNKISDEGSLRSLPSLGILSISKNNLVSLNDLKELDSLKTLNVKNNCLGEDYNVSYFQSKLKNSFYYSGNPRSDC